MSILSKKHFHDEAAAYKYIEARIWSNGRVCPHCGTVDCSGELKGQTTRIGLYKCYSCRKPFTVKVGTIFESSHIKMHVWLQAIFLISSSKKGISSHQLARILGLTVKSAWFMSHRIREAMGRGLLPPMGGGGGIVEADETYYGKKSGPLPEKTTGGRNFTQGAAGAKRMHKRAIVSLVERGGQVRSFHVDRADKVTVAKIVTDNVAQEAILFTDESRLYTGAEAHVSEHQRVHHVAKEYARGIVNTNTIEGYFSIFKRGMKGVYQHCDEKHLHRYLSEFDFRYNKREGLGYNDEDRAGMALLGFMGKRLTYERTGA